MQKFTNEIQGRKKIIGFNTSDKMREKFGSNSDKSRPKSFRTPAGGQGRMASAKGQTEITKSQLKSVVQDMRTPQKHGIKTMKRQSQQQLLMTPQQSHNLVHSAHDSMAHSTQKSTFSHTKTKSHLLLNSNMQSQQKLGLQHNQEAGLSHYNNHNRSMTTIITENMGTTKAHKDLGFRSIAKNSALPSARPSPAAGSQNTANSVILQANSEQGKVRFNARNKFKTSEHK